MHKTSFVTRGNAAAKEVAKQAAMGTSQMMALLEPGKETLQQENLYSIVSLQNAATEAKIGKWVAMGAKKNLGMGLWHSKERLCVKVSFHFLSRRHTIVRGMKCLRVDTCLWHLEGEGGNARSCGTFNTNLQSSVVPPSENQVQPREYVYISVHKEALESAQAGGTIQGWYWPPRPPLKLTVRSTSISLIIAANPETKGRLLDAMGPSQE